MQRTGKKYVKTYLIVKKIVNTKKKKCLGNAHPAHVVSTASSTCGVNPEHSRLKYSGSP
jgi:hypothetical protein